jgi:hypothetical protein
VGIPPDPTDPGPPRPGTHPSVVQENLVEPLVTTPDSLIYLYGESKSGFFQCSPEVLKELSILLETRVQQVPTRLASSLSEIDWSAKTKSSQIAPAAPSSFRVSWTAGYWAGLIGF